MHRLHTSPHEAATSTSLWELEQRGTVWGAKLETNGKTGLYEWLRFQGARAWQAGGGHVSLVPVPGSSLWAAHTFQRPQLKFM